jgi:hypothetical protein
MSIHSMPCLEVLLEHVERGSFTAGSPPVEHLNSIYLLYLPFGGTPGKQGRAGPDQEREYQTDVE